MEKLPSTSYVRLVDIWLICGQLIPFIEVILVTLREVYNEEDVINHHGHARRVKVGFHFLVRNTNKYKSIWLILFVLHQGGGLKDQFVWKLHIGHEWVYYINWQQVSQHLRSLTSNL